MPITSPPSVTALPTAPDPNDRTTFNARAYPWSAALGAYSTEISAVALNVYNNAVDAASSASTASTAASTATTKAGEASASASTASTQAASVAALDKRYLGAFATPPTLDNQGAALQVGAVYYDSTNVAIKTWTGSAWLTGVTAVSGVSSVNGASGAVTVQATLVSGTNIKTVNGTSLLGSGNISVGGTPDFILMAQGVI